MELSTWGAICDERRGEQVLSLLQNLKILELGQPSEDSIRNGCCLLQRYSSNIAWRFRVAGEMSPSCLQFFVEWHKPEASSVEETLGSRRTGRDGMSCIVTKCQLRGGRAQRRSPTASEINSGVCLSFWRRIHTTRQLSDDLQAGEVLNYMSTTLGQLSDDLQAGEVLNYMAMTLCHLRPHFHCTKAISQ
jgi:hypothetical protein